MGIDSNEQKWFYKVMNKVTTDKVLTEKVFVGMPEVTKDGANVTPRLKKDGTIVMGSFRNVLTTIRDFVIVGGDFV